MIAAEQNESLTRAGRGTPTGDLFRRYWLPALLAEELPERDGPPVRVKLLGERLIAFRDTQGRLGLIAEFCAHRGVSLWFGRNEDSGIRCPYHGWKYDVTGQCIDVPSEPGENGFCARIKLEGYPCVERGGVIWAYLGPPDRKPAEPGYDWTLVPSGHRHVSKRVQESNWLQAMEGALDSIHSAFLHRHSVEDDPLLKRDPESLAMLRSDPNPKFLPVVSPAGLYVSTRRNAGEDRYYWRVTQWLMPCFSFFPPYGDNPFGGHAFVPIDDEHCWVFSIDYHPRRALTGAEREAAHAGKGIHVRLIEGTYIPLANKRNDYLIDRAAQKAKRTFSGVFDVGVQDAAIQESMGTIQDRARENLVSSDNGIIMTRRRLMEAAGAVSHGMEPPGLDPAEQRARAVSMVAPRELSLLEAVAEAQRNRTTTGAAA
jgi:phenylpropionate dioxygenase-like ring-hydroxylating dioxygenase large terminal subunit